MGWKDSILTKARSRLPKPNNNKNDKSDNKSDKNGNNNEDDTSSESSSKSRGYSQRRVTALCEKQALAGRWHAVVKTVKNSTAEDWNLLTDRSTTVIQTSTPLHLACLYGAPVTALDAIATACQTKFNIAVPEEAADEAGNTPLHTAVAAGCTTMVVQRLLQGASGILPAVVRNSLGQTALHVACEAPLKTNHANHSLSSLSAPSSLGLLRKPRLSLKPAAEAANKKAVVELLLSTYPPAATLRDVKGRTPLDYWKRQPVQVSASVELRLKRYLRWHASNSSTDNKGNEKTKNSKNNNDTQSTEDTQNFPLQGMLDAHKVDAVRTISRVTIDSCLMDDDQGDNDDEYEYEANKQLALTDNTIATQPMCRALDPVLETVALWQCQCLSAE